MKESGRSPRHLALKSTHYPSNRPDQSSASSGRHRNSCIRSRRLAFRIAVCVAWRQCLRFSLHFLGVLFRTNVLAMLRGGVGSARDCDAEALCSNPAGPVLMEKNIPENRTIEHSFGAVAVAGRTVSLCCRHK